MKMIVDNKLRVLALGLVIVLVSIMIGIVYASKESDNQANFQRNPKSSLNMTWEELNEAANNNPESGNQEHLQRNPRLT